MYFTYWSLYTSWEDNIIEVKIPMNITHLSFSFSFSFFPPFPNIEYIYIRSLRRECDFFHGENHFRMHALDPEIWLFENTCFVHGYTPLILTTC